MNWDYTLEMTGTIEGEAIQLNIAIKHFGHNVQGSYVSAELRLQSEANTEPRITCDQTLKCQEIKFVRRDQ
jgi:hypothetical protein